MTLKLQKRLAASVLGCGERKVWMDPNELADISMANSRKLILGCSEFGLWGNAIYIVLRFQKRAEPGVVACLEVCSCSPWDILHALVFCGD